MNETSTLLPIRKIELIAYDLDGTLLDSIADITQALNRGLARYDLAPYSDDEVKRFVGDGIGTLVRRALEGRGRADLQQAVLDGARASYNDHPADNARLFPGVVEMLRAFRDMGLRQIIVTNKPDEIAQQSCAQTGLADLVDLILGESPTQPLKPNPAMLHIGAERLGVALEHCILVGDGRADIETARAAGIACIGVSWGMNPRDEVESYGPDIVIDSMTQLHELLAPLIEPHPS